jgi:hypothetical protein
MAFLWLLVGLAAVSGTYLLFGDSVDPWPGLQAAERAAVLYFLVLVMFAIRPPFPKKARIIAMLIAIVFAGSGLFFSTTFEKTTRWQKSQLLTILNVIHTGILTSEMPQPLLATLESYHEQRARKTVGQAFREIVPGATVGKDIRKREYDGDSLHVYLAALTDDMVVLVGQPSWGSGKDPSFKNFDGKTGLQQLRATLTAKGVTYESDN